MVATLANKYSFRAEFYVHAALPVLSGFAQYWHENRIWHQEQSEQIRIARALLRDNPSELELLLLMGITELVCWRANRRIVNAPQPLPMKVRQRQKYESERAKIKTFDRIVEMLDHMRVGDKILGDCTRADLLRAAVNAEQVAGNLSINAAFYRELAGVIGDRTVREATNRGEIVALLTHSFGEQYECT